MRIIYVHGLDSTANSVKGVLLEKYCKAHHPDVEVIRPDLNEAPNKVFDRLCVLVQQGQRANDKVVIMGSSLGGYFASLVSNETGCPAVLLNPSTQPHISLQRFVDDQVIDTIACDDGASPVIYRTTGGWAMTLQDLDWFAAHKLQQITYPEKVFAVIKQGDELLDPKVAADFYQPRGVEVALQFGGDHRMTDFEQQLPLIMKRLLSQG
ncbi:YqiA/YcfP family alpha/beta fold hydrolase [Psychrobacter sp. UBA3962]|uniref:YqiA/YcfP family alpha/beta fold hydrolase n=1 Tax=Psychrobacter sp. UBA3962 TaxID=1947352 RepID=UPI0025E04D2C|nr:YqiA/YcfP family alpha/beta fold hydrolase [Psychrobacter sp. UBA3962]